MAKLPDVYQIYQNDGQAVVFKDDNDVYLEPDEIATWVLKDTVDSFYKDFYDHHTDYEALKVDDDDVRAIANNFRKGIFKLGEYEQLYPTRTINPILEVLKEEKDNLIRLSQALKPVKEKMEEENMKENEVAVRFYEGYISKEKVTLKQGDKNIEMKRVKIPNDDPADNQVRRSFLVRESSIGTDLKNPHMKFVYLNQNDKDGKPVEYRVVRKNFDIETKKSEILEDIKMTAEQIANAFAAERDRQYAEYKAANADKDVNLKEVDSPEEVIENSDGLGI